MPIRPFTAIVALLPLALLLAGCPHHVTEVIEETLPPEDYNPQFLSSTLSWPDLLERHRDSLAAAGGLPIDTLHRDEGSGYVRGTRVGPVAMDIRSVDDTRYPDQVVLQAYVYDTAGEYVSGLAPPNFQGSGGWREYWRELHDSCSGVSHSIAEYTVEEVSEESRVPYAIAIALDHSGSMGLGRVKVLRRAVGLFLRGISPRDNVAVISFTETAAREVKLTGSKKEWVLGFDTADTRKYGGGTNLYDAAVSSIRELEGAPEGSSRILILFTDGGDFGSSATLEQTWRYARRNNVTIYTIAYGPAEQDILSNLATYTGGRMYRIYSSREFLPVFVDLYRRLNHYYRITYRPPECASLHTVRATLALPELGIDRLFGEGVYDRSVLTPFDSVGSIAFVAIEFDYDRATIRPESDPEIAEVVDILRRYPTMRLEIRGHTDDVGEEEYNQELSERRARAVADRIAAAGIDRDRLEVRGFGESRPLVPNDSDENRKKNRRTEFVVLEQ